MGVVRQVPLRFRSAATAPAGLSAVCRDGPWLWSAGDEAPNLERLRAESPDGASYSGARSFGLGSVLDLPEGPDEEVDVEGLDRSPGYLWVVGSHSRTRKDVRSGDTEQEAVDRLGTVRSHPNRQVLARLPLDEGGDGPVPVRSAIGPDGVERTAALLDGGVGGLADVLSRDVHLAPFLALPGKDNGLDVEGLLVLGDTVLLGLRGPVLRGWAVVLALRPQDVPGRPDRLTLGSDRPALRTHFLDLEGLGVRDLCRAGDDVVVLAGPTMDLDGPVRLYRWRGAALARDVRIVRGADLVRVGELPHGRGETAGRDHAEGITPWPADGDGTSLLVVYDSPAPERALEDGAVLLADVVAVR